MLNLELKIPPPIVMMITAGLMWLSARLFPSLNIDFSYHRLIASLILFTGILLGAFGLFAFGKAGTTFNPAKPEKGTALVTGGIYKITRNPMYLGLFLCLLGFAVYLSNLPSALGPLFFVIYITRFQIKPEEKFLLSRYGEDYANYMKSTRRWI